MRRRPNESPRRLKATPRPTKASLGPLLVMPGPSRERASSFDEWVRRGAASPSQRATLHDQETSSPYPGTTSLYAKPRSTTNRQGESAHELDIEIPSPRHRH